MRDQTSDPSSSRILVKAKCVQDSLTSYDMSFNEIDPQRIIVGNYDAKAPSYPVNHLHTLAIAPGAYLECVAFDSWECPEGGPIQKEYLSLGIYLTKPIQRDTRKKGTSRWFKNTLQHKSVSKENSMTSHWICLVLIDAKELTTKHKKFAANWRFHRRKFDNEIADLLGEDSVFSEHLKGIVDDFLRGS